MTPPHNSAPAAGDALDSEADYYDAAEPAASLRFDVAPPERPAALLERLGPPPSWSVSARLREFLAAALDAGSRLARSVAPRHAGSARRQRKA